MSEFKCINCDKPAREYRKSCSMGCMQERVCDTRSCEELTHPLDDYWCAFCQPIDNQKHAEQLAQQRNQEAKPAPTEAIKHDSAKPRLSLLPPNVLLKVAEVMGYGAEKYADHNYKNGFNWTRVYDSVQRHLLAWLNGEDTDPESGLPHLTHAISALIMLADHTLEGYGVDDRFKRGAR